MSGFVSVFKAMDEVTANIVKLALEGAGIQAVVRARHCSWFDGIFVPAEGLWGEVLVPAADAERAAELLKEHGRAEQDENP